MRRGSPRVMSRRPPAKSCRPEATAISGQHRPISSPEVALRFRQTPWSLPRTRCRTHRGTQVLLAQLPLDRGLGQLSRRGRRPCCVRPLCDRRIGRRRSAVSEAENGSHGDFQSSGMRKSHALMRPPRRLAATVGRSQYRPPPALARNVAPATARSAEVAALGENRSTKRVARSSAWWPARRSRTSMSMAEATAQPSSSSPRGTSGCGATRTTATTVAVVNKTRVCAARKRRLGDVDSALLLMDAATNSKPVSAPATLAIATPKFTQSETS